MANHLEDLTSEWLEFNGYFVRKSVLVGKRSNGGFDGELDVVGIHIGRGHLIHVECSLDADPWPKREMRFTKKFEQGRKHIGAIFSGVDFEGPLDQVALMQFGGGARTMLGGGRLIWVADFMADVRHELAKRSPDKQAVPSTYPLLRSIQLAVQPERQRKSPHSLIDVGAP